MKLLIALAEHYFRGSDNAVYTDGPHRRGFWNRYLDVFDELVVLSRVRRVERIDPAWARVDDTNVSVWDLPDHTGPWEYLAVYPKLRKVCREAVAGADAYLLRTGGGGFVAVLWREIRRRRRPYALEVVADPWDALAPGTVKGWGRPIGRYLCVRNLRTLCRHAAAVAYVTREALQRRYPSSPGAISMGCSDVTMPEEVYVSGPRVFTQKGCRLVHVGVLGHFFKAPDVLVEAVALCKKKGFPVRLRILGGGRRRAELEALIRSLGIEREVDLLGQVAGREVVLKELDEADLFVLPSRQEGLPRAMVEAMGRALPCLGSTRGGMPELLPPEDLVPPEDTEALANKIMEILGDPERMTRMSTRNLEVATEYRGDVLRPRWLEFYQKLRALSGG